MYVSTVHVFYTVCVHASSYNYCLRKWYSLNDNVVYVSRYYFVVYFT